MRKRKHLVCKVGDHTGLPPRDIAPDTTPITLFTEDGKTWCVCDVETSLVRRVRKLARQEGIGINRLLSRTIVKGFTELVAKGGF